MRPRTIGSTWKISIPGTPSCIGWLELAYLSDSEASLVKKGEKSFQAEWISHAKVLWHCAISTSRLAKTQGWCSAVFTGLTIHMISMHSGWWEHGPYPLVQFSSVAQSCLTLCDPVNHSRTGLPVHHQTLVHQVGDAIQPSHPLSPFPPAPNPSQHQSLFQRVNSSHEVAKVLEFQL